MKKLLIKSISLVLILIMSALMMFSCKSSTKEKNDDDEKVLPAGSGFKSIFPQGWTGGGLDQGSHHGLEIEYWWIETYDELMIAIDKLKSHGSTFQRQNLAIMNYDGDLFDVKYCIIIYGYGGSNIKFGDDPFDRIAKNVQIETYGFFDDVTIDELNYSYISEYDHFEYCNTITNTKGLLIGNLSYRRSGQRIIIYDEHYLTDHVVLRNDIIDGDNLTPSVTEEVIDAIINSSESLILEKTQ